MSWARRIYSSNKLKLSKLFSGSNTSTPSKSNTSYPNLTSTEKPLKRILVLGAPGAGKGTFIRLLNPVLNLQVVACGDIVREMIKLETPEASLMKERMEKGELIPDEMMTDLVTDKLITCKQGFMLDGFPRNKAQAEALDDCTDLRPQLAINFHLPYHVLIYKLASRWNCSSCGQGYNTADIRTAKLNLPPLLPKKEGICDKCGGTLTKRADDTNENVISNRLKIYDQESRPLLDFYAKRDILLQWEIRNGIEDTLDVLKAMDEWWGENYTP